jgi:adenine-specific DNA-methyltransferase
MVNLDQIDTLKKESFSAVELLGSWILENDNAWNAGSSISIDRKPENIFKSALILHLKKLIVQESFDASTKSILPGLIYEYLLGYTPVIRGKKLILLKKGKSERKSQGVFFTPGYIIQDIIKETLTPLTSRLSPDDISEIKILDPSMGCGFFLLSALDFLVDRYFLSGRKIPDPAQVNEIRLKIATECLYGVDIDPLSVELAQISLANYCGNFSKAHPSIEKHLKCGNALIGREFTDSSSASKFPAEIKPFHWDIEFPQIKDKGLSAVIGNPPWITHRHSELGKMTVEYLKKHYESARGFKVNIFPLFLERSLNLLKGGGQLGMIVPNRLFDTPSYMKCRSLLLKTCNIESICSIPSGAFRNVTAGNAIIIAEKTFKTEKKQIPIYTMLNENRTKSFSLKKIEILKDSQLKFNIDLDPDFQTKGNLIHKNSIRLSDQFEIHVGIMIKRRGEVFKSRQSAKYPQPVITSKDIQSCRIIRHQYFSPNTVEVFGGTKKASRHLVSPKIVIRKTGDRIVAALDKDGVYCEQSLYMVIPREKQSINYLKAVCVILNSDIVSEYYRNYLITNPKAYPYLQHYDASKLPIPSVIERSTVKLLVTIYDSMDFQVKKADSIIETLYGIQKH